MAVLEALAVGLPVIGSDLGGIPELIDPGQDGLLVPPGDDKALATAMGELLGRPRPRLRDGSEWTAQDRGGVPTVVASGTM